MKQLPFLHLATSDEVSSTHLLSPFELGCVFKLRFQLWENNSIPLEDNDIYLAKICNTTPKKFRLARVNFDYLFETENGIIFHISDREKWHQALHKSKINSENALARWNKDNANALQSNSQLEVELKSEQKLQLQSQPISISTSEDETEVSNKWESIKFDKSIWDETLSSFKEHWQLLKHRRGNLVKAVKLYLVMSNHSRDIEVPSIDDLFKIYNKHILQYSDQPKYIKSLDKWIEQTKFLEDTSFDISQSLNEKSETEFQDEMDQNDWKFCKKIGKFPMAYSSERITRIENKFGSIAD